MIPPLIKGKLKTETVEKNMQVEIRTGEKVGEERREN